VLQVGDLQGKPPSIFLLMELVSVLYEVFEPGSARFPNYRSVMVFSYRIMFQCCSRSSGQVRRSLLSIGPLVYVQGFNEIIGVVVCLVVAFGGHPPNVACDTGYVGIIMEQVIADIPGCIECASEDF